MKKFAQLYLISAITLLLYDHALTLGDEIKYVWKESFSITSYLFVFLRYWAIICVSLTIFAHFSPLLTEERCRQFALFEPFGVTFPLLAASNIIMIQRVYALYNRNRYILFALSLVLVAQLGVGYWIYGKPGRTVVEAGHFISGVEVFHICTNIPDPSLGGKISALYLFFETAFDTAVFVLTSYKTYRAVISQQGNLFTVLAKHGFIYYAVIFTSCLLWALMVIFAPPGLQYINASPTDCLSVTVVCRITIDLRKDSRLWSAPGRSEGASISNNLSLSVPQRSNWLRNTYRTEDTTFRMEGHEMSMFEAASPSASGLRSFLSVR